MNPTLGTCIDPNFWFSVIKISHFTFQAKTMEFENATIAKQRTELQLLISELKDRDRELNEMVLSHQRQIGAWDADRKKIMVLEERGTQYESEYKNEFDDYEIGYHRLHLFITVHTAQVVLSMLFK